jgi:hypothetical protein
LVKEEVCSNAEKPLLKFFHSSRLISLPHFTSPKVLLNSIHVATYNINSEKLLKPTLHKYYIKKKHANTWFMNTLHTIQHSTLWQVKWKCLIIFCHAIQNKYMKIIACKNKTLYTKNMHSLYMFYIFIIIYILYLFWTVLIIHMKFIVNVPAIYIYISNHVIYLNIVLWL